MRRRPGTRIGADDPVVENFEAVDRHRLDAKVEGPGLARGRDPGFDQAEELVEDRVLQRDAKRQQPVEPALDRRQVLAKPAVLALELQAGQLLEPRQR